MDEMCIRDRITALELMPVYEFYEIPSEKPMRRGIPCDPDVPVRVNYWGFGPALYFAPKASYAVSSDPVAEFADRAARRRPPAGKDHRGAVHG